MATPRALPHVDGRAGTAVPPGRLIAYPTGDSAVPLLTWPCFDPSRVRVALTTRHGGRSPTPYATLNLSLGVGDDPAAVADNRAAVAAAFGAPLDDLVFCRQVHDRAVTVVTDADRGRGARPGGAPIPATDALVTAAAGPVLVVLVADCVPIVIHDPVGRVLAVVHAGWRGTTRGVTAAAVAAMADLGSRPADLVAAVGPAISARTYQVGADVAAAARRAFGERTPAVLRPDGDAHYLFDLATAARLQLTAAGVPEANVNDCGCTTGNGTPFYSHRATNPGGRFAVLARLVGRP